MNGTEDLQQQNAQLRKLLSDSNSALAQARAERKTAAQENIQLRRLNRDLITANNKLLTRIENFKEAFALLTEG